MITDSLLSKYPIITEQVDASELRLVLASLEQLLVGGDKGSIVEFGCYIGTTSLFISRLLNQFDNCTEYHVFDSFEGLPEKLPQDFSAAGEQFKKGELLATKNQFITNYKKAGLKLPTIHKGWFKNFSSNDVPDEIVFAFLDGDYYESIQSSLKLIEPKIAKQSVIMVDDYSNEALPGVAKAVDEWLKTHPSYKLKVQSSLAIITSQS